MEKFDDINLISLEVLMLECVEDDFTESKIVDFGYKILEDIQKLIDTMIKFVKDLKTDIVVLAARSSMKAKLVVLRSKAKDGECVSIPDFKRIESIYTNACNVLPRELKKLLKASYPIKTSRDLEKFEDKKEIFEDALMEVESELASISETTKVYNAKDAYYIIDRLLKADSIYVNSYYKAIKEFEQFKTEYSKLLKEASRKNDGLGKKSLVMHKSLVAKTSASLSRMLKKSIFLVSAIVV